MFLQQRVLLARYSATITNPTLGHSMSVQRLHTNMQIRALQSYMFVFMRSCNFFLRGAWDLRTHARRDLLLLLLPLIPPVRLCGRGCFPSKAVVVVVVPEAVEVP